MCMDMKIRLREWEADSVLVTSPKDMYHRTLHAFRVIISSHSQYCQVFC